MTAPRVPTVAIAGGGPAGAVAALVLARRGLRAVVVEAASAPVVKPGETLPPALTPLLRRLGLEEWMAADGHLRAHGNRSFWGSFQAGEAPFIASPFGAGWHVDRRRFEGRLAAAARRAGAEWLAGRRVERCARAGRRWRLELSTGEALDADFVADATGRRARLARSFGARRRRYDRLIGIFGTLAGLRPIADTYTLVEAVPEGWWYSARLADGNLAVCLFGDGDLLDRRLLAGEPGVWLERLRPAEATRARLEEGGYGLCGPLRALPANSSRLDALVGDGWIALGDAAAGYDPLSSHGVASAMGSGFYGACAVADLLAGRSEAADAYRALMQRSYGTYLDLLREHYGRERRWPEAPFWRRRHASAFALAA